MASEFPSGPGQMADRGSPADRAPTRRVLRRRILILTVVPLVVAISAALVIVQASVDRRLRAQVATEMETAQKVLEEMFLARSQDLALKARVVARDPKFFAILSIPPEERTEDFAPTIRSTAEEFRVAMGTDLLEIFDLDGRLIAASTSVALAGPDSRRPLTDSAAPDLDRARRADSVTGTIVFDGMLYQVAALEVVAGGQPVGLLRYGRRIDQALAERMRTLARAEVAFVLDGHTLVSSGSAESGPILERTHPIPDLLMAVDARYVLTRSLVPEQRYLANVRLALGTLGILFAALAFLIGSWLAGRITHPVNQLLEASARLERGDYDAPVQVDTKDELEALARTFDSMRQSLHKQITSLAELDQVKSDFLALASHELRTPVTILQGCVEILEISLPAELAPEGPMHRVMLGFQRAARDLSRLVEQVTDMTLLDRRQMQFAMSSVDLLDVLKSLGEAHQEHFTTRRLTLALDLAPAPLPISADRRWIMQAIDHLILNAIRFTPDGGRITLRGYLDGPEVVCEVQDSGIGIPADLQKRIFDPLFEGKNVVHHQSGTVEFNSSGLGLGLAICQKIVEAHGGRIQVISSPGQGSLFRVAMPRASDRPDEVASPTESGRGMQNDLRAAA